PRKESFTMFPFSALVRSEACNPVEYGVPTIPDGSGEVVVIDSGVAAETIVRLKDFCTFCCALSVTPIVKLNVPAVLGVPRSIPLDERLSSARKESVTSDQ